MMSACNLYGTIWNLCLFSIITSEVSAIWVIEKLAQWNLPPVIEPALQAVVVSARWIELDHFPAGCYKQKHALEESSQCPMKPGLVCMYRTKIWRHATENSYMNWIKLGIQWGHCWSSWTGFFRLRSFLGMLFMFFHFLRVESVPSPNHQHLLFLLFLLLLVLLFLLWLSSSLYFSMKDQRQLLESWPKCLTFQTYSKLRQITKLPTTEASPQ